jgi:integrase/recombinase XerC
VLDASNGNVRMAQKLSRHKNLDVLTRYDDNRVALQKKAVHLLADLV